MPRRKDKVGKDNPKPRPRKTTQKPPAATDAEPVDPDPLVAACARVVEAKRELLSAEKALRDLLG